MAKYKEGLFFNENLNLLEEERYAYRLQDVAEPELYRNTFNYDEIPKTVFNHRHVPMDMPKDIWITDTTFRDGQQSTSPFTVEQIKHIYALMSRLGGEKGIIRQSEFFIYSEKDQRAARECMEMGLKFPEVTSWIRANEKDFALVKEMGVR
ncbi:MAG: 2-isopropylmalate synthase, partial [Clostridia bacterium]|nr:2-isopropylmalate synthase [Clostridia bacterium]